MSSADVGVRTGGLLRWSVRQSSRSYVEALLDGREAVTAPAMLEEDGSIDFPAAPGVPGGDPIPGVFTFSGAVSWWGHGGMLDVVLRDLQVEVEVVERGRSTIATHGEGTADEDPVVFAAFMDWETANGILVAPQPRLTWAGVSLFGGTYAVGDPLDPLEIAFVGGQGVERTPEGTEPTSRRKAPHDN